MPVREKQAVLIAVIISAAQTKRAQQTGELKMNGSIENAPFKANDVGWIECHPTDPQNTPEGIRFDSGEWDPIATIRCWHPIKRCLQRNGTFVVYYESGGNRYNLTINPTSSDPNLKGEYEILGHVNNKGDIIYLKEYNNPPFERCFRFKTVCRIPRISKYLSWQLAIAHSTF